MAVAREELEQLDTERRLSLKTKAPKRLSRSSGPLQGFNDPATQQYRPLQRPIETSTDTADDKTSESTTSQEFRAGTVAAQQKQQQSETNDRALQYAKQRAAIQQGVKAKDIPIQASSAQDAIELPYKRGWQIAQEVVEDLVIPSFFLADLVLIPLYLVRWIGGNMMGGLFTITRTLPGIPGISSEQKISIKLIPGYSLADPLDYVRHFKFLLLAVLPLAILGFILMLLYFWTNWAKLDDPTIRGIWSEIINTIPGFNG